MKLTKRLQTIANFVNNNSNVLDVGCDHALVGIYLTSLNKNINVVASDNKEGPLKIANENIKKYKAKNIITKLSNGIEDITDNINTLILAGLGGINIVNILTKDKSKLKNVDTIIISSNSDLYLVRKTLNDLGYFLKEEKLVEENKKIYFIQKFIYKNKTNKKVEQEFGLKVNYNDPLFIKYINKEVKKLNKIYKSIPKTKYIEKLKIKIRLNKVNRLLK